MVKEYPAVSSPHPGCFTGPPVRIAVPADAQPRYQPCRQVPFPLMNKMEEAIDKKVARGVWVPYQDYRWASAIVPVSKKDGSLRLCADYKGTVNPFLSPDTYRTPTVDEVLGKLAGGQIFGEIDLEDAYTQIPVDEDTSRLLAVNTIKGLYRVTRVPFGVKVASAVFQRIIDSIVARIPDTLSPRMLRWVLILGAMDYTIEYHPGPSIGNADFLSRLPLRQLSLYPDPAGVLLLDIEGPQRISSATIAAATHQDPLLSQVCRWTVHGWPQEVPPEARPYLAQKDSLSTLHDCLLRGDRLVVPQALRPKVLELIHSTHPGSKAIARAVAWWPGVDKDVEDTLRLCTACQEAAHRPPRTYRSWPKAEAPWERVHLDYAGPFMGHYFLIVIDDYSTWPVVKVVSDLSAKTLVTHMRYIFADLGLPKLVVTDKGGSFASEIFRHFLAKNSVKHLFSPPWHPASNGLAERTVQTFKALTIKFGAEADIHARLARVL
ncbi:hypothetical protein ONE63_009599 [Megalurothrips usitatus]|uniref:RNA-directed DNA polymerase n=1 Tax=Megalurothrips usitatus TaxID=439358 RepID=A0AAV7XL41_9NEOP|nr:hypothetical protein ONE63_009599 [Megalurothrips usitatus]